jgi:uroporphyrinogen-III synthase
MMQVLVTRPEPDASEFAALCRENGLAPVLCPLMEVVFETAAVDLTGVGALAFTSANGVRAYLANSDDKTLPVFAVGEATARTAADAGFKEVKTAGGDVEALAGLIAGHRESLSGTVLHIAGAARAGDLIAALEAQHIAARRMTLYTMHEAEALPAAALSLAAADWVALFSPRTAALFAKLVERAGAGERFGNMRAACLSDAVAEAAGAMAWRSVHVARARNAAAMIALMKDLESQTCGA